MHSLYIDLYLEISVLERRVLTQFIFLLGLKTFLLSFQDFDPAFAVRLCSADSEETAG